MTTFPIPPGKDDTEVRQALVRSINNQSNQSERHFRRFMASHEDLADKGKEYAERSDQGHHSILSMVDELSDQIAEGHELMATKADIAALEQKVNRVVEHLKMYDHVQIPRDQSTVDPEDDFFD